MAHCSNKICCSVYIFNSFFMLLEKVRLFFTALGWTCCLSSFGPWCFRVPVRNLSYSLAQVHRCMRTTQLELCFNFINTLVCYIWYFTVHEFLFSLLMFFKSKGNTHWKNCTQCYWSPSFQQGKGTAHILFLVTVSAGIWTNFVWRECLLLWN